MMRAMAELEGEAGVRDWLMHFYGGAVEKRFCHSLRTNGFAALAECRRSLQQVQSLARVAEQEMSRKSTKKTRRRVEELVARCALVEREMQVALYSVDVLPLGIFDDLAPTILAAAVLRAAAALALDPTDPDTPPHEQTMTAATHHEQQQQHEDDDDYDDEDYDEQQQHGDDDDDDDDIL
jgi:hypothetical protein